MVKTETSGQNPGEQRVEPPFHTMYVQTERLPEKIAKRVTLVSRDIRPLPVKFDLYKDGSLGLTVGDATQYGDSAATDLGDVETLRIVLNELNPKEDSQKS